ncbi:hypothetical protein GCM10011390_29520 [Aureimonas endophytica]|uniref:Methyl-accepting chemotaxis protein n=1 Tax=Aureimonas endophytica TaxID=2027858 RepID=A0A916ZQ60_9HYPH|nr:HAMP domain-containing methyl-accepting chemotaxis protein [Aureimonas endophytica]GGE08528.1 hypothetical protein GCM10011390_29520 [Aureimonas endophytica]
MNANRLLSGIGARLSLGFGAVLFILVAMAAHSVSRIDLMKDAFAGFGQQADAAAGADDLTGRLLDLRLAIGRFLAADSVANLRELDAGYEAVKQSVERQIAAADPERRAGWTALRDRIVEGYDRTLKSGIGIETSQAAADKAAAVAASSVGAMSDTVAAMVRRSAEFGDVSAIATIQDKVLTARMLMRGFITSGNDDDAAEAQAALRDAERKFDQFRRMGDIANHPLVTDGRKNLATLFATLKNMRAAVGKREAAVAEQTRLDAALATEIGAMRGAEAARMEETKRSAGAIAEGSRQTTVIVAGVALFFGIAVALLIGRGIVRPIRAMTGAMRQLAAGDLAVAIPGTARRDEIGAMAGAMQVFKTAAIERRDLAASAEDARRREEEDRRRAEAEAAARAISAERAFVAAKLGAGLHALAEGDLTMRLDETMPGEYETLRQDFNSAIAALQAAVAGVAAGAGGIASGSREIGQAAGDLSRRTETQAASLEETAATLSGITEAVRQTSESARVAQAAVGEAKADAEASGGTVSSAVAAMAEIEASSGKIERIIGVIDEIAFQTNLLALNAGVEAARAGEAGRGFAVVAQEVRALAQRSAEASKEIKGLISTASREVGNGVALVHQAGEALTRIAGRVMRINEIVSGIAASARDQASGLAEVNEAVDQMDKVTQQNAAMVEETTAATRALIGEARNLSDMVDRFRVEAAPAAYARAA